jgi:plasmid stabilization system protein ParE
LSGPPGYFGADQAAVYGALLAEALALLEQGPAIIGARPRDEIDEGLRTLHVGRPGRHIILFRVGSEHDGSIDVLRICTMPWILRGMWAARTESGSGIAGRVNTTMAGKGPANAFRFGSG